MGIQLCTNTCLNLQFKTQRQVGKFESKCFTLSMNREVTCSNESVATGKFESDCPYLKEIMVVRFSATNSVTVRAMWGTETVQSFMSANIGKMTLHMKRRPKCETEAKIQDTQVSSSTTRTASFGFSTFSYVFFQGATVAPTHPSSTASPCLRRDWY